MKRASLIVSLMLSVAAAAGCAKPAPPAVDPAADLDLRAAAQQIASDLARQLRGGGESRSAVIDPVLDRATGQQTTASSRLEQELGPALAGAIKGLTVVPFNGEGAEKSPWVVTGNVAATDPEGRYSASVSITDRQSGLVVAQSAARFREAAIDNAPTRFYSESPSVVRDRSVDGYLTTSETPAGKPADALYVEQVPTSALLAEALAAYNAERWDAALKAYSAAATRADGQQLRTFNGLYLANVRLGQMAAAEEAFGKIAALGIATNNLAVKVLFRPGTTDFVPGADLGSVYPMWLRQIARAASSARSCLNIVGHTSRSGSEALNDKLSVSRADTVRGMLERENKALAGQLRATGVGYRENVVGTGTDDARDAIDRRVEFKVVPCGR